MSTTRSGRTVKLTDRSRLYKLGQFQDERNEVQTKLYSQLNEIRSFINSEDSNQDVNKIISKAECLQNLYRQFLLLHGKCQILLSTDERSDEEKLAEKVDLDVCNHQVRYNSWLNSKCHNSSSKGSSKTSHKSKSSKKTSRSRSSQSLSDKLAFEKAKLAELKVEKEFRGQLEEKRKELEEL